MKEILLNMIGAIIAVFLVIGIEIFYIIKILLNIPDEHNPD